MPAARLPCGGGVASPSLNKYYGTHMNPGSEATHIFLPFSDANPSPLFTGDTEPRRKLGKHRGYQSSASPRRLFTRRADSILPPVAMSGRVRRRGIFYALSSFFQLVSRRGGLEVRRWLANSLRQWSVFAAPESVPATPHCSDIYTRKQ